MALLWWGYQKLTPFLLALCLLPSRWLTLTEQAATMWNALWRGSQGRTEGSLNPIALRGAESLPQSCGGVKEQILSSWALKRQQPVTDPESETQLSHTWIPNHEKPWDSKYCFHPLNFGAIYYTIGNQCTPISAAGFTLCDGPHSVCGVCF